MAFFILFSRKGQVQNKLKYRSRSCQIETTLQWRALKDWRGCLIFRHSTVMQVGNAMAEKVQGQRKGCGHSRDTCKGSSYQHKWRNAKVRHQGLRVGNPVVKKTVLWGANWLRLDDYETLD